MKGFEQLTGENLSFEYPGAVAALSQFSLSIAPGARLALVGQNGSGKTTLAKLLAGLLTPQSGEVWLNGSNIAHIPPGQRAQSIGFVFQNPDHQIFSSTVRDEIAFGPRSLGLTSPQLEQRVEETLVHFELEPFASRPPASLSFGRRRQVSIASVYSMNTPVLILDEPSLGLDWRSATSLMDRVLSTSQGPEALIFISHDLRLVARYADEIVLLDQGQLIQRGKTHEILCNAKLLGQLGFSMPRLAQLTAHLEPQGMPADALDVDTFCQQFKLLVAQEV